MEENNTGHVLWHAVEVVNRAGHEINALLSLTTKGILDTELANVRYQHEDESYGAILESEWVYFTKTRNISLTPSYKQEPKGVLGLEVVIGSPNDYQPLIASVPALNVLFDSDPYGYQGTWEYGPNMITNDDWSGYSLAGDNTLIFLNSEEYPGVDSWSNIREFYFSVPLTSLNRPEDIDQLVLEPVQHIFANLENINSDKVADFFKTKQELIRYEHDEQSGFAPVWQ